MIGLLGALHGCKFGPIVPDNHLHFNGWLEDENGL